MSTDNVAHYVQPHHRSGPWTGHLHIHSCYIHSCQAAKRVEKQQTHGNVDESWARPTTTTIPTWADGEDEKKVQKKRTPQGWMVQRGRNAKAMDGEGNGATLGAEENKRTKTASKVNMKAPEQRGMRKT